MFLRLAFILILLAGCSKEAGVKMKEYGAAHELVDTEYASFRVYEHPTEKTLAVGQTNALLAGAVQGLTLGAGSILSTEAGYQRAAEIYMSRHDVFKGCKVTNGYPLAKPFYEFVLDC